jgi:hypothetical protein
MAEVFLNPMFTALNGRAGTIVFYSYSGRVFFRAYVRPRNPDTPAQRTNRGLFREAMKAWQALSSFDKDGFSRRAKRLGITGHNLFISRYMRSRGDNRGGAASDDAAALDVPASRRDYPSIYNQGHSVSPGMTGRGRVDSLTPWPPLTVLVEKGEGGVR